jgi:hypothetical protein
VILRRQDGQIIPLLVMVMLSLFAIGVLFFQVGRAAIFSTEAQTAADAAALAAVKDIRAQLMEQLAATGTSSTAAINPVRVAAAAELYALRNQGHVTNLERNGVDVKVWVSTKATLGRNAEDIGKSGTRGTAKARARLDLIAIPGSSILGNIGGGGGGGGGDPTIDSDEWNKLGKEISDPPACGTDASSNDLVKLGDLLREHGFIVHENAEAGDFPEPVHEKGGYHYKCRNSGAIDVNWNPESEEPAVVDGIVKDVQKLGFRTIWRAPGHTNHIHIDLANSGAIGAGFGDGGAVGALEETMLEIKLIDWEAKLLPFSGLGGLGSGGFYGGPPDPDVARAICGALDDANASPKIRLAAFETAIVESGVHNLNYGDLDSVGVFQQRTSQGWGKGYSVMDPGGAAGEFIRRAKLANQSGQSAGQLAQAVQISGYPLRYDQVALQAAALMEKFCT